jgi:hypothetical protein
VAKNTSARLIQNKVAKRLILGDPITLIPDGLAGWRGYTTNDDIPDFALGVAGNHVNYLRAAHKPKHLDDMFGAQNMLKPRDGSNIEI